MTRAIGPALFVVGVILIVFGLRASESIGSDISNFFTGTPTDRSMWLLLGGVAALIVGSILSFRRVGKA
jgi:hypothetical protein